MHAHQRAVALIAGAAVAASAIAVVAFADAGVAAQPGSVATAAVIHHLDGNGPLGSTGDPTERIGNTFYAVDPGPWTLGYELCLAQGSRPATIEMISPASTVGSGLNYLGAYVRQFPSHQGDLLIGSAKGFPPAAHDRIQPAGGFVITQPCVASGEPDLYQELDLGLGKPARSTGGGWNGINVAYLIGSTQYVVTLNAFVVTCGPTAPAYSGCTKPKP